MRPLQMQGHLRFLRAIRKGARAKFKNPSEKDLERGYRGNLRRLGNVQRLREVELRLLMHEDGATRGCLVCLVEWRVCMHTIWGERGDLDGSGIGIEGRMWGETGDHRLY